MKPFVIVAVLGLLLGGGIGLAIRADPPDPGCGDRVCAVQVPGAQVTYVFGRLLERCPA